MNRLRRVSGLLFALALPLAPYSLAQASAVGKVLESPAMQVPQADQSVFVDLARAGDRLVAVGERGLVLLSDDNGQHWRQAEIPVSVGLTAVQFIDSRHGWAVGHSGVVLATVNGGESWQLQLDGRRAAKIELEAAQRELQGAADVGAAEIRQQTAERFVEEGADKPLLALHFIDASHGIVVGAYGLAFRTRDGGASWQSIMGQIDNPDGMHLYAIERQGKRWFLAGEQGYLGRSEDDGLNFTRKESPYPGTFFTLGSREDGTLLVGGLKGRAFVIRPGEEALQALPVRAPVTFTDAYRLTDGRVLLANQAGGLFVTATDSSERLLPLTGPGGTPLSGVVQAADGSLVLAGFTGLSRLPLPSTNAPE